MNLMTIKMAMSATISTLISDNIGLGFSVTAGIISILSIQSTKKKSIEMSFKRSQAAIISILLSYILYLYLGNEAIIFGLFLLIFIPITKKLNIEEGMTVGAVLSTHLLISENINYYWILNEILLTFVGISVAFLFNLFTTSAEEKIEKNIEKIELLYKEILSEMSESLLHNSIPKSQVNVIKEAEILIKKSTSIAHSINENYLFKNETYYIDYIKMRNIQLDIIKKMTTHFRRFYMTYEQTNLLSKFTKEIANNIYTENDCKILIENLENLRSEYKSMELPKTREEFENRALLYQFVNDLEDFLVIKREFKKRY